jgi:hypothetical protein
MFDFVEIKNNKKFSWKWDIKLNEKIEYPYIEINVDNKENIIINPSNELLLQSQIYHDNIRKGYICCDIILKEIDSNEINFYKNIYEFISFIIKSFYDKFNKSLNKNILKFINPLNNNKIKTYMAKRKDTNQILTNLVNINTLEKYVLPETPLDIYIFPKLIFKSICIINKCIYIDIVVKSAFIHRTIMPKEIEIINKNKEKGIVKLPNEVIINIMKILIENGDSLENLIFTSKYFFYIFIKNYEYLHERWTISNFSNKNVYHTLEWKHQKIKSILNY